MITINLNEEERKFLLKTLWDINLIVDFKTMTPEDKQNFIKISVSLSDKLRRLI